MKRPRHTNGRWRRYRARATKRQLWVLKRINEITLSSISWPNHLTDNLFMGATGLMRQSYVPTRRGLDNWYGEE
jgi:cob(I)alamin adenosyltransferase